MSDDIVKFQMPDGTVISNDPRFHAQQYQGEENQGDVTSTEPVSPEVQGGTDDQSDDTKPEQSLSDMTGEELKAEVARLKEQGIEVDTSGVKNKGQLVERIKTALAEAEESDGSDDNS